MAFFRQFGIGTPLIGTPITNSLEDIAIVTTGSPVVNPHTGRPPPRIGYDPLESAWEAFTEAPILSDAIEIVVEITQDVIDAVDEIVDFVTDATKAAGEFFGDVFNWGKWLLEHPLFVVGSVILLAGGALYIVSR